MQEQLDQLKALPAPRAGPEAATTAMSYLSTIQSTGAKMSKPEMLELRRRMGSGIAHGDIWATLSVPSREQLPSTQPGIANFVRDRELGFPDHDDHDGR